VTANLKMAGAWGLLARLPSMKARYVGPLHQKKLFYDGDLARAHPGQDQTVPPQKVPRPPRNAPGV